MCACVSAPTPQAGGSPCDCGFSPRPGPQPLGQPGRHPGPTPGLRVHKGTIVNRLPLRLGQKQFCSYLHFTEGETEARREDLTCARVTQLEGESGQNGPHCIQVFKLTIVLLPSLANGSGIIRSRDRF